MSSFAVIQIVSREERAYTPSSYFSSYAKTAVPGGKRAHGVCTREGKPRRAHLHGLRGEDAAGRGNGIISACGTSALDG